MYFHYNKQIRLSYIYFFKIINAAIVGEIRPNIISILMSLTCREQVSWIASVIPEAFHPVFIIVFPLQEAN